MTANSRTKTLLAPARFLIGPREANTSLSLAEMVKRTLEKDLEASRRERFERLRDAVLCEPRLEDPDVLLQNVSRRARSDAQRKNVPLVLHAACRRVLLQATFVEALVHLLDNAIRANRAGQPIIMDVREEVEGHVWQIHDMGDGMLPNVLAALGDPFAAMNDGSGLGVALANAIVQDHQGVLGYESAAGVGTTATVWVPLL
jgi:signal transduction histidine kinase